MPVNPYEPPKEGSTSSNSRSRPWMLRTLLESLAVSVMVNVLAWVFIALTDSSLPRMMMAPGFGLAWHANVLPGAKYAILFGVNLGIWTLLAVPFVMGVKTI